MCVCVCVCVWGGGGGPIWPAYLGVRFIIIYQVVCFQTQLPKHYLLHDGAFSSAKNNKQKHTFDMAL